MTWSSFLEQIENQTTLNLVGPLLGVPFSSQTPTIFVDGGNHFRTAGGLSVSVGDGDSGIHLDHTLNPEKDFSDLAFVLKELPKKTTHLLLHGFLGGRKDHEWAVFGELHRFLKVRPNSRAEFLGHGNKSVIVGFRGQFSSPISGHFSVLRLETGPLKIEGACKYPYQGNLDLLSSHGISNEGHGLVTVSSETPVFIFLNEVS
jgi:thiamine pyrophosphokinase